MQTVIFDMDGTLIDTERVSQSSWCRAASDLGITLSSEILHAFVGCSIPNAKEIINAEFGDPDLTERLFEHQAGIFMEAMERDLELKPGAAEAIAAAKERGLGVALATSSGREYSTNNMTRFGLMDSFDVTVFKEDIENHKPAPDVYLVAAERLGVDPAQCIAVEDSFNGVRAGAAAGMHVVMVPDYNEPTDEIRELCAEVLPSLTELPAALDRLM
ncbi:HAD family phosphatase [Collinsella stercoris]|uniref:HAD family hydrolase n=1 Tax=Collinsella stercoris TaxID=147206 RepID=UPI0023F18419|nr:HAD family phosphatase [Collinsella stercoris]MEE0612967.1 HAD family phosphatase [Collinsella stercoris]